MRGEKERRPSDPSSVSVKHGNIFDLDAPILTPLFPSLSQYQSRIRISIDVSSLQIISLKNVRKKTLIMIFEGGSHLLLLYFD